MHSEVTRRRPSLLSLESGESGSNTGVGFNVNPVLRAGVDLQSESHAAPESNARAVRLTPRQAVLLLALGIDLRALKAPPARAAVAGEG